MEINNIYRSIFGYFSRKKRKKTDKSLGTRELR